MSLFFSYCFSSYGSVTLINQLKILDPVERNSVPDFGTRWKESCLLLLFLKVLIYSSSYLICFSWFGSETWINHTKNFMKNFRSDRMELSTKRHHLVTISEGRNILVGCIEWLSNESILMSVHWDDMFNVFT